MKEREFSGWQGSGSNERLCIGSFFQPAVPADIAKLALSYFLGPVCAGAIVCMGILLYASDSEVIEWDLWVVKV